MSVMNWAFFYSKLINYLIVSPLRKLVVDVSYTLLNDLTLKFGFIVLIFQAFEEALESRFYARFHFNTIVVEFFLFIRIRSAVGVGYVVLIAFAKGTHITNLSSKLGLGICG